MSSITWNKKKLPCSRLHKRVSLLFVCFCIYSMKGADEMTDHWLPRRRMKYHLYCNHTTKRKLTPRKRRLRGEDTLACFHIAPEICELSLTFFLLLLRTSLRPSLKNLKKVKNIRWVTSLPKLIQVVIDTTDSATKAGCGLGLYTFESWLWAFRTKRGPCHHNTHHRQRQHHYSLWLLISRCEYPSLVKLIAKY